MIVHFVHIVSYTYNGNLQNITNSALQLNQTVPIQMKTRLLHATDKKKHLPGIIVAFLGSENSVFCVTIIELVSE